MDTVQTQMRTQVQSHIDSMRAAGLDLNDYGEMWKGYGYCKPPRKFYEFGIGYHVGDAQIDDWMPLLEDGLIETDTDEQNVYVAAWLLA